MKLPSRRLPTGLSFLVSLAEWIEVAVYTVICFCVALISLPVCIIFRMGRRGQMFHFMSRVWAKMILGTSPIWRLHVEGLKNIRKGKPYVIIANHQSMLDILVLLAAVPLDFRFIAKQELFSLPFVGWHMTFADYIPIVRNAPSSRRKAILEAEKRLRKGASLLIFPEGTRSPDGVMRPFKLGAVKIAQKLGIELLPVVIDGTGLALPKNSWRAAKTQNFIVSIGKPTSLQGVNDKLDEVRGQIWKEMDGRLARFRGKKSESSHA